MNTLEYKTIINQSNYHQVRESLIKYLTWELNRPGQFYSNTVLPAPVLINILYLRNIIDFRIRCSINNSILNNYLKKHNITLHLDKSNYDTVVNEKLHIPLKYYYSETMNINHNDYRIRLYQMNIIPNIFFKCMLDSDRTDKFSVKITDTQLIINKKTLMNLITFLNIKILKTRKINSIKFKRNGIELNQIKSNQ